jgi:hypothetical protein
MHNPAFSSEDCRRFACALEQAWEMFLLQHKPDALRMDTGRGALSYGILEAAEKGVRNVRRLAIHAVARVEYHEAKLRAERFPYLTETPQLVTAKAG